MTEPKLKPEDFKPLNRQGELQQIARPSLSYWRDAMRRFRQQPRNLVALAVIVAMVSLCLFGRLVWTQDPAEMNLDQMRMAPSFSFRGAEALVVTDEFTPKPDSGKGFRLLRPATTVDVPLTWDPVPGADFYRIFRNEGKPADASDLGIPLGQSFDCLWVDALKIERTSYYYSIVAVSKDQVYAPQELKVDVEYGITASRALDLGYEGSKPGDRIRLPSHPLGTDSMGRDMLARVIQGGQISLFIGLFAPLLYIFLGVLYGGFAGYLGGRVDNFLMRFADFIVALPFILCVILLKVASDIRPGESGIMVIFVALVLLSWPGAARLVRGQILQIRNEAYVQASTLLGASPSYLILRHMLPNTLGVVLVALSFAVPAAIFTEAFLSFIGMGVTPPETSWGAMCESGVRAMRIAPHELIVPATFISITVLAFNLVGDGLRDALDAKMRGKE
ncbi:MAG: hypothetical protein RL095_1591 [Verrucomicrobiota bacterium]|jgi:oligopeptide transport system permease protein